MMSARAAMFWGADCGYRQCNRRIGTEQLRACRHHRRRDNAYLLVAQSGQYNGFDESHVQCSGSQKLFQLPKNGSD